MDAYLKNFKPRVINLISEWIDTTTGIENITTSSNGPIWIRYGCKKQFNMHIEGNILVKNESKIPHSVTGVTW